MHEKMLKWLKQKPTGHHNQHQNHQKSQGSQYDGGQNKIITDDPLATIQVHPQQSKKSKNKSEEIYAVSRVNPLFEEEDVPKVLVNIGGNHSGSSGYDSGQTSDDDSSAKFLHQQRNNDASSTSSTSSFTVLSRAPPKHGQLFQDEDDPIVHHQAAILAPNGKPVLHIVEQNPDFVHSIAVSVGAGGRPLSPINESVPHRIRNVHDRATKVSIHPIPFTKASEDHLGVAKLITKENKFVHSIRIGGQAQETNLNLAVSRVIESTNNNSRFHPSVSSGGLVVTRKPSVTFSERVELVASNDHGNVLVKGSKNSYGRKPSAEQDSIVTESLLLMTSRPPVDQDLNNAINSTKNSNSNNNINSNGLINSSKSTVNLSDNVDALRKVSTGSSVVDNRDESQRNEDLEAFSSSIRKNRPVVHILSNSGKSLEISPAADHYSSSDFIEGVDEDYEHDDQFINNRDSRGKNHTHVSIEDIGSETDETRSSSNNDECSVTGSSGNRRPRGVCPKSPFGGIADLYSAAKEIAKEIDSYGDPNNKTISKKSIVRELLSGRGRDTRRQDDNQAGGGGHRIPASGAGSSSQPHPKILRSNNNNNNQNPNKNNNNDTKKSQKSGNLPSSSSSSAASLSPRHVNPAHNAALEGWEEVRVQQVYLKGRSWKEIEPLSSSSASGSSSSSPESHTRHSNNNNSNLLFKKEGDAGQRVLQVIQQGQVQQQKVTPALLGNKQQVLLKGSIYDGVSSEGASSNNDGDEDTSSDSGHSTDRNSKHGVIEKIPERRPGPSRVKGSGNKPPDPKSSIEDDSPPSTDKVMIVTGDSQNMVVDLSGIPQDLRDAIISGSALITLPDGLNQLSKSSNNSAHKGYTIVTIPSSYSPPTSEPGSSKKKLSSESSSNSKPLQELDLNAIASSSSGSGNNTTANLHILERGDLYNHIFNNYGTKNKTQIWDVMQQSVQQTLIEDEKGKKKRITTVLPFHPNQDVNKSPDFTMEGQRSERQRKKLDFAKKRRCICRVFGIMFFLATFIGVLVALSMIYTKGQRYFGSA